MLQDRKYKYDQAVLKVIGIGDNRKIELVHMYVLRTAGVECDNEVQVLCSERGTVNDEKMQESILRTKRKIYELAFCNPWDWFFTATLDPQKYDRTDLKKWHSDLTQWLRNYNRLNDLSIKFLLVPELHSDAKSWHMHGFLYDLPQEHLIRFKIGDRMGKALADKVKNGDVVYNWVPYMNKFGFCDLEPIKNHEAASKYIRKYISKNLAKSVTELNAHQYYHSRGLKFAEIIKKGSLLTAINKKPDFENDYCKCYSFPYSEELLTSLKDNIVSY